MGLLRENSTRKRKAGCFRSFRADVNAVRGKSLEDHREMCEKSCADVRRIHRPGRDARASRTFAGDLRMIFLRCAGKARRG
jgi:hypothetical protein